MKLGTWHERSARSGKMGDEIKNKIQGHGACFIVEASRPSFETSESRVRRCKGKKGPRFFASALL